MDYSSRLVEDQQKLTTRFMHVSDVLTEADYWARKSGCESVTSEHVDQALQQRKYRASLTEERMLEFIENNTIHIDTVGDTVGQVNGLTVYSLGDHSFGRPSRITARVSVGNGRVVNIDRETRMSGRIHNKGFMILNGFSRASTERTGVFQCLPASPSSRLTAMWKATVRRRPNCTPFCQSCRACR